MTTDAEMQEEFEAMLRQRVVVLEEHERLIREVIAEARKTHHFVGPHAVKDLLTAIENVLGSDEKVAVR
jgi:hypothetical protein